MPASNEKRALEDAIKAAKSKQAEIAEAFGRLAAASAPDRSLERDLKDRQTERDEALKAVGEALLVWVGKGGSLDEAGSMAPGTTPRPAASRRRALPPVDDDTGETVFATRRDDSGTPTITRRRRRMAPDGRSLSGGHSRSERSQSGGHSISGGRSYSGGHSISGGRSYSGGHSIPADPDSLKTFADSFGGSTMDERAPDAIASVKAFMDAVGDFEPPATPREFLDGIQRLARVGDRTDRWKRLPRRVQQMFLAYCTCKARVWQENLDLGNSRHEVVLEQVFRALTRYSARERPGFVHGLSRTHRAERETWSDDAHYWWTELALAANLDPEPSNTERQLDELSRTLSGPTSDSVAQAAVVHAIENGVQATDLRLLKLLNNREDLLDSEPRLKAVRRAMRDALPAESLADEEPMVTLDWPWLHVTEGKSALIVGGASRAEAGARIQKAFRFADVHWHDDDSERRLQSVVSRIQSGKVGMLFYLARFSTHAAQGTLKDACKGAGVPFVRIEHGYGVQQLKLAIENWMHGKQ